MSHDDYKKLDDQVVLEPCPVCGSAAELWQYSTSLDSPTSKVVCCSSKLPIGPRVGVMLDGCLLYMPPDDFYRSRIVEAVKYWNEFAKALEKYRRDNHWHTAKVLGR
jgi:hypothetical protein